MEEEKTLEELQQEATLLSDNAVLTAHQPSSSDLVPETPEIPKIEIPEKEQNEHLLNVDKVKKNRSSIWLMIGLSVANLVLTLLNGGLEFPFSLVSTKIIISFAYADGIMISKMAVLVMAAITVLVILIHTILHAVARKHPITNIIHFGLFILDTLLLVALLLTNLSNSGIIVSLLLEVAAHAWIVVIFISLIKTENKIKKYKKLYQQI